VRWVGLIVMDASDRKRSEEALRKTEKLAATGRLAASIAHEINNPWKPSPTCSTCLATTPNCRSRRAAMWRWPSTRFAASLRSPSRPCASTANPPARAHQSL
jgi:hypothetical protein